MTETVRSELAARIQFLAYRFRFLGLYVVFGVLSLLLEFGLRQTLANIGVDELFARVLGIAAGVLFAFWANVMFNFRIPKPRRNRALVYFMAISCGSALLQGAVRTSIDGAGWSYEEARLVISGLLFIFAYSLHRRFSFRDFKKVGVAIYANGIDDVAKIHGLIGHGADFIHIDLVDRTFSPTAEETYLHQLPTIRKFWPRREVQTHIMSRQPSLWLADVLKYSDVVYIHAEIDENVVGTLESIRQAGRRAGLAFTVETPVAKFREIARNADNILCLAIAEPGRSGQRLDERALDMIDQINSWPFRRNLRLCVDGGVNERNASLLQAEEVVSGSAVLTHQDPRRQILRLQTSSRYEVV